MFELSGFGAGGGLMVGQLVHYLFIAGSDCL